MYMYTVHQSGHKLKALPLVHFLGTLLLKEQNNDDLC